MMDEGYISHMKEQEEECIAEQRTTLLEYIECEDEYSLR
jgi:hypothetical protein